MRRILAFAILVAACTDAPAAEGTHWVRVAQDPNYTIWIDTTRVTASWANAWDVWYRTDHAQARNHKGQPFNHEVVNSYLRCADLAFRVVSVDMYASDWKLVATQRDDSREVEQQPWRPVLRGSSEEVAARAACHYGRQVLARYPGERTR
jgi:hypothetical protein